MISRFQPTRLTTPVLILLVIAAVSYWANPEAWQHLSMGTEALFAGSLIAIAGMIVLFRRRMYLQIDERGIEVQLAVGAPRTYLWQEIESAGIFRVRFLLIPLMSSIHLRLRSTGVLRGVAGRIAGFNASFPAFFDWSAEEIMEKIEFYQRQIGNGDGSLYAAPAGSRLRRNGEIEDGRNL